MYKFTTKVDRLAEPIVGKEILFGLYSGGTYPGGGKTRYEVNAVIGIPAGEGFDIFTGVAYSDLDEDEANEIITELTEVDHDTNAGIVKDFLTDEYGAEKTLPGVKADSLEELETIVITSLGL